MYIRFVAGSDGDHHFQLTGIITEARLLRDQDRLERHQVVWLEDLYRSLNERLPCRPFSTSDWGQDAVSWFKDDATVPISQMWEIASILQEHGVVVRVLRSRNPGKILYEDDYQIVVKEWKHL